MQIKQFNTTKPNLFEANRTQVNVGIVDATKNDVMGYEYITIFFNSPQTYTDEALEQIAKKEARNYEVDNIKITIEKGVFHGNEDAQRRLKIRHDAMNDGDTWSWKSVDGAFVSLSKEEFKEIITQAINIQDVLWNKYG